MGRNYYAYENLVKYARERHACDQGVLKASALTRDLLLQKRLRAPETFFCGSHYDYETRSVNRQTAHHGSLPHMCR
jgi:hypothetical protein